MSYKSGVYAKLFDEIVPMGGHAVKIVGALPPLPRPMDRLAYLCGRPPPPDL